MIIFPAIDLYEGQAVRLFKGDYQKMTVYDKNPANTAIKFKEAGAEWIHVVDLEGAKSGGTPNADTIKEIIQKTKLKVEIGGGIRNMETIDKYVQIGASRVILGTAAITNSELVVEGMKKYGDKIAVGADIKDGYVAIKGWTEKSQYTLDEFCDSMEAKGVKTIICTDISKDGAMKGTNEGLYSALNEKHASKGMQIIASGGVSSIEDIKALRSLDIYGAIVGKAYYEGAIDLAEAIKIAR